MLYQVAISRKIVWPRPRWQPPRCFRYGGRGWEVQATSTRPCHFASFSPSQTIVTASETKLSAAACPLQRPLATTPLAIDTDEHHPRMVDLSSSEAIRCITFLSKSMFQVPPQRTPRLTPAPRRGSAEQACAVRPPRLAPGDVNAINDRGTNDAL